MILGINMNAVAEGLRLGSHYDLPQAALFGLLKVSTGDSWVVRNWEDVSQWTADTALAVLLKDLEAAYAEGLTQEDQDAGITTEITLVFTVLAGALADYEPGLAAGVGVIAAILLAARTQLHHFVGSVLTESEARDALVIAGATLVVLPLLPNLPMGPYNALNPHAIWVVVVLVLVIGAAGHVAVRALGARYGLPVAGLASGFISSTATIGAMGARAKKLPAVLSAVPLVIVS